MKKLKQYWGTPVTLLEITKRDYEVQTGKTLTKGDWALRRSYMETTATADITRQLDHITYLVIAACSAALDRPKK